jgi:small-conductance mechanosensitive channel|tara:strand:- start:49 stop:879 length:831 start_codon:yes stop_codon:yes gene_type:complete
VDEGLVFAWFIAVALCVSAAIKKAKKSAFTDYKIRNLQGKAAAQVFGVLGAIVFGVGLLMYSGLLARTEYIVGISALTYAAFSQYSPVNGALSFLTVAYKTEFAIDDWIKISNQSGDIKGKVKDFSLKGVRLKTFDMSEAIVSCDELLHSVVENLTPNDLFRWETPLSVSKMVPVKNIENVTTKVLEEHNLSEINDEEGFLQKAYIEFHDDKLDFKPNFRRISIYTYHPKWIPMAEGAEPIGYEVAYQLSREFKRDIYERMDNQKMSYVDTSFVMK